MRMQSYYVWLTLRQATSVTLLRVAQLWRGVDVYQAFLHLVKGSCHLIVAIQRVIINIPVSDRKGSCVLSA